MSDITPGPVDPDFNVKFMAEMFDFGCAQGLAVSMGKKRHAIAVRYNSTPLQVAQGLRALADWIEKQSSFINQAGGN